MSFKRDIIPAASEGECNPVDGDCGLSGGLYVPTLEELMGMEGREALDDPSSDEENQESVGIAGKRKDVCSSGAPLQGS